VALEHFSSPFFPKTTVASIFKYFKMANTYHQIRIQTVFAVKYREALILPQFQQELFGYIGETINQLGHKTFIVNGTSYHVHCYFGLSPRQVLSDLMREVKANSSNWINSSNFLHHRFEWQEGYGAFSYSKSQDHQVYSYVQNQAQHHQRLTFREEYLDFLRKFEIEPDELYIFKEPL
jgi:REP element-mobilizing transposase RayT